MGGFFRGLSQNRARTDPWSEDGRLRGRTYAIPFDDVWTQSLRIANERIRGWTVVDEDDQRGVIEVESATRLWRFVDDVHISVGLDEDAQTRVDMTSASRVGRGDLGRNPRTIGRFLRELDRALAATPAQILDATGSRAAEETA